MHAAHRSRLVSAIACCLIASALVFLPSALADSASSDAYAQLVKGDSPLAYWRLNGTSTSTTDATGHGHTLQWVDPLGISRTPTLGAQAIPALQPDTAVQFDGADSAPYGEVGNDGSLNPETFSVEAWVKPIGDLPPSGSNGNTREAIISSYSGCEPPSDSSNCELRGYQLYISNYFNWGDHPQFAFSTGDEIATGKSNKNWVVDTQTTVKKDTWYHVVATATPRSNGDAEMHLYVNGKNVANCPNDGTDTCPRSYTFDPNNSDEPTYLGLGTREAVQTYRLDGEMDEVAVYDHMLTADRVLAHYNAGTVVQPTLSLTYSSDRSTFTGGRVGLSLSAGNVSAPLDTNLTAKVISGPNKGTTTAVPMSATTATFSYKGTKPGTDTVQVSGTVDGITVYSNPLNVYWLAGATSAQASYGNSSSNIYAYVPTCFWGDPVNSVTGNFYETYTDAKLPGTGIPFSLDRTYNSLDNTVGPLGKGWSTSVFTSLSVDDAGNATVKGAGGEEVGYILQDDGSFKADSNVTAKLAKTSSGYDLVLDDQNVQHFDSSGNLISWLDPNGQGLHFAYNGAGQLASVKDSGGREVDFSYNSDGRLSQLTLPDSSTISYAYDGDRLSSVTDQTGAITKYAYDASGFLASATDGSGKVLFQNTYDDQGRVVTQTDPSGNTVHFDWSAGTASDPSGTWKDSYTDRNELSKRVDALGDTTTYSYNAKSEPVSTTDPLGGKTTMTYDERGNMLTQTDALGNTESWTYDQDNNVLSHTDKLGNTTSYTYDSNGNVLTETDPLGNVTSYRYDSGRLIKTIDPLGRVTQNVYDGQGNLIKSISPSGATTTYAYDANGNKISETDPLAHATTYEYDAAGRLIKTTDPRGHSTTSNYDEAGRLLSKTDANGNKTSYVYDSAGRQTEVIAPDGSSTKSSYDELGNLVASTDALGKVTHYEYDPLGRQTATISPTGERAETTYDANGNVTDAQDPLGNKTMSVFDALGREIESTDAMSRTTKTVYDADGNVTEKIDALGNATTTKYDADGRVVKETDPLGYSSTTTYDAAGQTISETDANGGVTLHSYDSDGNEVSTTDPAGAVSTSAYDADGNLTSSTDPLGHATTYSYDAAGNKISQVNPLGAKTTYSYDPNGNEISETDPLGNVSKKIYDSQNRKVKQIDPLDNVSKTSYDLDGNVVSKTDPLGATTSYEYDSEGRLVKETDPLGNSKTSSYDKAGRLISETDANGHTTTYAYDADGEKTSVTAPGGAATTYAYDADGNVLKRTDANGHATSYAYDAAGRKTAKTDPLGRTWKYSYDGNGNLVETDVPSGGAITESYDAQNRLAKKSYSDGSPTVSYTYDKAGNKTQMVDGTGTTRYAYNAANERTGTLRADGSFLYSYDLAGNLTSRTYPNGLKTSYTYNQASELTTAKVGDGKTYYTHDPNGKLVSTLNANGILENRTYDAAGHLTDISGQDPKGRPLYSRSYTYDPVGNPLTLVATAPRDHSPGWWGMLWRHRGAELTKWTETYTYDSQDRLAKACMTDSCSRYLAYSYDQVGNRVKLETREGATTYSYDAADELLSTSKHCRRDVITYAYDLNGNETRAGEKRYSYNLENELIAVSDEHGHDTVSYTYSADGLMATRSTRQEMTSYSWDTNSDLPQLATETDSKGQGRFQVKDSRSYTYGEAPLGIVHGRDALTFHTDAIGSVVELSDDHGQIVDSYRYTPFGESYGPGESDEAPAETSENPIRYAGQYLDEDSGLYDMRAREYDPEIARFLETDPVTCDQGGSCGSIYVYVDDRPTVETDPSGMCPIDNATPTCMKNWKYPTMSEQARGRKTSPWRLSKKGVDFLVVHEGGNQPIYNDNPRHPTQSNCTVGPGIVVRFGSLCQPVDYQKYGSYTLSMRLALFRAKLKDYQHAVNQEVQVALYQYEYDALVSFVYNIGYGSDGFAGSSPRRELNMEQYEKVPYGMMLWITPPTVFGRRCDEARLFATGKYTDKNPSKAAGCLWYSR